MHILVSGEVMMVDAIAFGRCFNALLGRVEADHKCPELFYRGFTPCITGLCMPGFSHDGLKSMAAVLPAEVCNRIEFNDYFFSDPSERRELVAGLKNASNFFNLLSEVVKAMYDVRCGFPGAAGD